MQEHKDHNEEARREEAVNNSASELSEEALQNLAGYFDVLIQMDLAQKERDKRIDKEEALSDENLRDTNNTD